MLYWICPECGHECSPAIRECPTCTASPESAARSSNVPEPAAVQPPPAQREGASQELLSLAKSFQSTSSVALLAPPAVIQAKEPEPQLSRNLMPLDCADIQPARPRRSEPVKVIPTPVPVRITAPAGPAATPGRDTEFGLGSCGLTPPGELTLQAARVGRSSPFQQLAEPLPSRRQSVAFVRADVQGAERGGMAFTNLAQLVAQPDNQPLKAVVPFQNGQPRDGKPCDGASAPLAYKPGEPCLVSSRLKLTGESLAELLDALKVSAEEMDRAAIDTIQASFSEPPAVGLLAAPAEIVSAPAPPAAQWLRSQKLNFTPLAPEHAGRANVLAGPQAPPLAGPSLPPQLLNFDHQNSSLRGRKRKSGWAVSLLVAAVIILGVGGLFQFVTQNSDTKAASVVAPVEGVKPRPAPPVRVVEEHPGARSVEVAGVRIVVGPNKKPQVQYLVINHSSSELMGLSIRIAVRSVEALADAPLFTVSSAVATLGPNQSKEIRTDLDSSVAPSSIPDWHSLRTEVLIARQ